MATLGHSLEPPDAVHFERLYREHQRRVRWVLRARGIRGDELDDLVHEAFIAMHRRMPRRDRNLSEQVWVSGVARSVAFAHRRGAARRHRTHSAVPDPAPRPLPDEEVERRTSWQRLEHFLDGLDAEQREAFVLIELVGMSASEVAAHAYAPANTVWSRLRLARRRFEQWCSRDAPERTRFLRAAGAGERPSPRARERTWAAIATTIGFPAPLIATSAAPAAAAGTWISAAKWAGAIAATSAAAATALTLASGPRTPDFGGHHGPPETDVAAAAIDPAPRPGSSRAPTERPLVNTTPTVPATLDAPPRPEPARAVVAPTRTSGSAPTRPTTNASRSVAEAAESTSSEIALAISMLREAEETRVAGDAAAALATVDRYHQAFPHDPLRRERSRLERRAACTVGDDTRARSAHDDLVAMSVLTLDSPICP